MSAAAQLILYFGVDKNRVYYEPLSKSMIIISLFVIIVFFLAFLCLAIMYVKKKKKIGALYIPAWISTLTGYCLAIMSFDYIKVPDPLPNFEAVVITACSVWLCIISIVIYGAIWIIRKIINHYRSK